MFGRLFLLKRFKFGTNPTLVQFDDYRIWFHMINLPYMHRTEEDIRFLLHDFLPVNALKPCRHQVVPAAGYRIQTTLGTHRKVPTGINIDEEDGAHFVHFRFVKLPHFFCQRCRKLGHRIDSCDDPLLPDDEVLPPAILHAESRPMPEASTAAPPVGPNMVTEEPRLSPSSIAQHLPCLPTVGNPRMEVQSHNNSPHPTVQL